MKIRSVLTAAIGVLALVDGAFAQSADFVVMRRSLKGSAGVDGAGTAPRWAIGSWSPTAPACTATAVETRTVVCQKGERVVADASCMGEKPATQRTVANYEGCSYDWTVVSEGPWSSACSASTTRERISECRRSDGARVDDGFCSASEKPGPQTGENYGGCSYTWIVGDYGPWTSTCSTAATRTRNVECRRSDGQIVNDAACPQPTPIRTEGPMTVTTNCEGMLVNGGFESTISPWALGGGADHNTSNRGNYDLRAIKSGSYSVHMPPKSWVEQTVDTIPGVQYTVSYWSWQYGGRTIKAYANNVQFGNAVGTGNNNGLWFNFGGTFVATSNRTTLRFANNDLSGRVNLDDVVMAQTPQ